MIEMSAAARSAYVTAVRSVRPLARASGVTGYLERRSGSRPAHWARSLLAIYDLDGLIELDVPWWTYGAIDVVEAFLMSRSDARVFEYGSGASTVWLAKRAGRVTTIEHDARWADAVHTRTRGLNVDLRLVEAPERAPRTGYASEKPGWGGRDFEPYVSAIDEAASGFDLIVIDGRARPACLHHALPKLAAGGLIVFDNSGRARYRAAIKASGAEATFYAGLTPSLPYPDETALLRAAPPLPA